MVAVIMGSKSDWDVMKHCCDVLTQFGVPHEKRVLSAHRTPAAAAEFISTAERRGVKVIIAAAGGAAHLAGVAAAHTLLPVLGVPMESACLLYTSDAADERSSVDLGGRRIIKKKKNTS